MLESIRYRFPIYLKTRIVWYLGIGLIAFDIALAYAYIQLGQTANFEETLKIADQLSYTLNKGG